MQANLLEAHVSLKDYVNIGSDSSAAKVRERLSSAMTLIGELDGMLDRGKRNKVVADAIGLLTAYSEAFDKVAALPAGDPRREDLIAEINQQVTQSSSVASRAVEDAEKTNAQVRGLAEAAQKIGDWSA